MKNSATITSYCLLLLIGSPLPLMAQQAVVKALDSVQVSRNAPLKAFRQSPQSVTVIDARKYYNRPAGALQLISQAPGVKVRQDGGLGSKADFSINGIGGKQVRFFINGIPADYLGAGNRINILPVNTIDHIEIYKGVVPVELGSDALGGAVNVVTRQDMDDYLDASYSIGSFHTHRAAINVYHQLGNHAFINAGGFYNYSDNNYAIRADVPDATGNPHQQTVKRFHDGYQDLYANVETGIRDTKWADLFSINASFFSMNKEVQNNVVMTEPYGKVTRHERTWNGGIKYAKQQLIRGLNLSLYAGASQVKEHFIDTSLNAYTWDGKVYERRIAYGEIASSRTDLLFTTNNLVGRLNLNYIIDSNSRLNVAITATSFRRTGKDSIQEKYYGQNYYANPVSMQKNTIGLAYQRLFFSKRLTSITSLKYFTYHAKGFTIDNMVYNPATRSMQQAGWNELLKWQFNPQWLAKLSYEYATRLPDEMEVFGDFSLVKANPSLNPETSHNFNAAVQYSRDKAAFTLNGFYRLTNNIIFLQASPRSSQYRNLLKALSAGAEAAFSYQFLPSFTLWVNGTYQHIINKSNKDNTGNIDDRYYNRRLPNTPYLFSNGELQWTKKDAFKKGNTLQCWYGVNYVHWFYLYWSNDGRRDTKSIIPTQWVQNAGISYALQHNRVAISAEIRNLTAAKVYDNFNVQLPGRAYQLKLRLFLEQENTPHNNEKTTDSPGTGTDSNRYAPIHVRFL